MTRQLSLRQLHVVGGLALLTVMSCLLVVPACAQEDPLLNQPSPSWEGLAWVQGGPYEVQELRGQVVVLRFLTNGCPYCQASAPYLVQWHEQWQDEGLRVIGVYHPKPPRSIRAQEVLQVTQAMGMTFPIAVDADWSVLKRYGLNTAGRGWTSTTFLIDRAGVIRDIHPGGSYTEIEAEQLESHIAALLNER